eukprot:Nk52_evm26s913 gene=Nk52_evmTU26s913
MNRPTLAFDASHRACEHVSAFKAKPNVIEIFRTVQRYISAFDIPDPKTQKRYVPMCSSCGSVLSRLHLCMDCVYFGCRDCVQKGRSRGTSTDVLSEEDVSIHKAKRVKETAGAKKNEETLEHINNDKGCCMEAHFEKTGHCLSVDIVHNYVYCFVCRDYQYDADLERVIYEQSNYASAVKHQLSTPAEQLVTYEEWKPDLEELDIMYTNAKRQKVWEESGFGLRGLNNLGNTCFMNCILQALLNNPLMRNFFLSDMHTEQTCPRKNQFKEDNSNNGESNGWNGSVSKGRSVPNGSETMQGDELGLSNGSNVIASRLLNGTPQSKDANGETPGTVGGNSPCASTNGNGSQSGAPVICLACEMHYLFQEVFSGHHKSYSPAQFLHSVWTHAHHLSGYEQQDAHEFFIACLDGMHLHIMGTKTNCQCIIHRIFTGHLRSDLKCLGCGNISTTVDPFWDISLDLKPTKSETVAHPKAGAASEKVSGEIYSPHALSDCLRRFTQPETLGEDGKLFCKICKRDQEVTKQLSFEALPIVICFHLKRFEHSAVSSVKIDTPIKFPSKLDMSPYLSSSICQKSQKNGKEANPLPVTPEELEMLTATDPFSPFRYVLYAVVNHHGKMDAGHYTAFVMRHNHWFHFDDDHVTKTNVSEVLKSEGYLLFYIKEQIDYKQTVWG